MPTATTEGFCFRYSLVFMIYQPSISLHVQMQLPYFLNQILRLLFKGASDQKNTMVYCSSCA